MAEVADEAEFGSPPAAKPVLIWQADCTSELRTADPERWDRLTALLEAHDLPLDRVPADTQLKAYETSTGSRALRVWVMDEGHPLCPTCEACIAGRAVDVPLRADLPEDGWHISPEGRVRRGLHGLNGDGTRPGAARP